MKIGIVVEPYEEVNESGIALCIRQEMLGLPKVLSTDTFFLYSRRPIRQEWIATNATNIIIPGSLLGKLLWFWKNYFTNPALVPDVVLFNMPLLSLVLPRGIKTVPIFYELTYLAPNLGLLKRILFYLQSTLVPVALRRAAHVVVPSRGSSDDLRRVYKIPSNKISLIYLGYQAIGDVEETQVSPELIPLANAPYFLFVGKIKFKKNIHGMIDAFIDFKKRTSGAHKFVLAGDFGGEYYSGLMSKVKQAKLEDDVLFVGYRSDHDRNYLYRKAFGLFFCTLQEGFGMPVIEAMSIGVPVLTSDITPLNEIVGQAALLSDPSNIEDMAVALAKVADPIKREGLIKAGHKQAEAYSWQAHNQSLAQLIASIDRGGK